MAARKGVIALYNNSHQVFTDALNDAILFDTAEEARWILRENGYDPERFYFMVVNSLVAGYRRQYKRSLIKSDNDA